MRGDLRGLEPILTAHLFAELDGQLIELLRSLTPDEWERSTVAGAWNVRQVAAHLLDTALRRLSFGRDGMQMPAPAIRSDAELVAFINELNAEGVRALGRLSPAVLISLTEVAVHELSDYLCTLDPRAVATIPVSWAGDTASPMWFDVARELTERWHHQQQIRLAVDRPGIMTPRLYGPVIDAFMRGLPHAYRDIPGRDGDLVEIVVAGECGGRWQMERGDGRWWLIHPVERSSVTARATIPQAIAWRVFTKGIARAEALSQTVIDGDTALGQVVLGMVAIVG